ncbi:MAG: hypothetical protein WAW61_01945 [Methylococcaceae bacterium]
MIYLRESAKEVCSREQTVEVQTENPGTPEKITETRVFSEIEAEKNDVGVTATRFAN